MTSAAAWFRVPAGHQARAELRQEERWWLLPVTAAEAGLPRDTMRGWRRALYYALSDSKQPACGQPDAPEVIVKNLAGQA